MARKGYIEGYYGRLLSWEDRHELLARMCELRLNTYVYAPKEDPLHRLQWRLPYADNWLQDCASFITAAGARDVEVFVGIAPGMDIHFGNDADFDHLLNKCRQFEACGAAGVVLLLDDVDPAIARRLGAYADEASAHAALANRLEAMLEVPLLLVPRVYAAELEYVATPSTREQQAEAAFNTGVKPGATAYMPTLATALSDAVMLCHCGADIVTETLDLAARDAIYAAHRGEVILWDNLYANDYCPRRLFLGPWRCRDNTLDILINPTGLLNTDRLLLSIMAKTCIDSEQHCVDIWLGELMRAGVPAAFLQVAHFFDRPVFNSSSTSLAAETAAEPTRTGSATGHFPDVDLDLLLPALDELLWRWKSPLANEWYPFLMGLRQDLLLSTGSMPALRVYKSYSRPLAQVLTTSNARKVTE